RYSDAPRLGPAAPGATTAAGDLLQPSARSAPAIAVPQAGVDSERRMAEGDFPLFPLGIVALPGELIPLHIFEERYKTMINECLEQEHEFGIVWLSDDGLREVGCACAIDRVLERMEDGRMNLLVRGTRPIRVLERQGHLAYPAGLIEFVVDREDPPDPDLASAAHEAYAELVKRATDRDPDAEELAGMSAYAMAATVDF